MTSSGGEDRPRFLADEGFNQDVTTGLRRHCRGIDLVTVQEAGLVRAADPHLLETARRLDRIVLSHDVHTMPKHFFALLAQLPEGAHLPGLLLTPQRTPVGSAIAWIAEVWLASRHDEWRDRVEYLPL